MGALPLRSLSRLWGYLNSFEVCCALSLSLFLVRRPVSLTTLPLTPAPRLVA